MKFNVSSSALLRQLQNLSGVLGSSNSLPILDCYLFKISQKELKIVSSDLETTMSTSLEIDSQDEGIIAIPAKILIETMKSLPANNVLTFEIDDKKHAIEISSDFGTYKLVGYSGDEFPSLPELTSSATFEIDATGLLVAINNTLFAVGTDDLRPAMTGVFIQLDANGATFVATDAHKLVKYKRTDAKSDTECSYIIPKKPLGLLKNILSDKGSVKVEYNKTNVSFSQNNIYLVSKLIDEKYPNYNAVIPQNNPNTLLVDRELFLSSIKRVAVFSNKTTNQIRLKLKQNEDLTTFAEDLDFSNEANENIKCDYKGEDLEIGFNARFLMEILSQLTSNEVILELNKPNNAAIVKPYKTDDELLMLCMPVMLHQNQ